MAKVKRDFECMIGIPQINGNTYKYSVELSCFENTADLLVLKERTNFYTRSIELQKSQLIEDFIYKNLETPLLETMKLKIEKELLERKNKNDKPYRKYDADGMG